MLLLRTTYFETLHLKYKRGSTTFHSEKSILLSKYKIHCQHTKHVNKYIPYCAHFCQLIDSLKPVVDGLREQGGKLLIVEDLEAASGGNLANCCRMKTVKWVLFETFPCQTCWFCKVINFVDLKQKFCRKSDFSAISHLSNLCHTHGGSCSFWTGQISRCLRDTLHTPRLQHSKGVLLKLIKNIFLEWL